MTEQSYLAKRAALNDVVGALGCQWKARVRDECGDYRIEGKLGWIYLASMDGNEGLQIYCVRETKRSWTLAKHDLGFCRVTQDGDTEGMLLLDRMPTQEEAEIIRRALGLKKRREMTEEALAQLQEMRRRSPLAGPRTPKVGQGGG